MAVAQTFGSESMNLNIFLCQLIKAKTANTAMNAYESDGNAAQ